MSKLDLDARPGVPAFRRYGLSVLSVAIAAALTMPLQAFDVRVSLFFPAVLLATWFGGTRPGLLAVLLSIFSINFFFTQPLLQFKFGAQDIPNLVAFLVSALLISSWSSARRRTENCLRESEQRWRGLTEALPQLVWGAAADGACDYFSRQWTDYTGVPEAELLGWRWMKTLHPDDREPTRKFWTDSVAGRAPYDVEYRVQRKDGLYGWFKTRGVPIRDEEGNIEKWFGTCTDISDRKEAEASLRESENELRKARDELEGKVEERTTDLRRSNEALRLSEQRLAGENRVLEMVAKDNSLGEILDQLCRFVEEAFPDVLASILLMDPNGKQLRHGGAPNLPKAYTDAIDGLVIGDSVGSCGTAASRAEQVIVSDIAADPLWADFRDLASAHSLRACWSTPIFSSAGKVIGTFAMYYREPRSPNPMEQDTIKHITYLAGIAIQRKLAETARRESEAYLAEAQRLSHTGSWAWTPATGDIRYCSDETYRILGFDRDGGPPRFETFLERLSSEDKDRVKELFESAVRDKTDFETDFRVVHPSGETRHIHAVGHPVCDETGNLKEFVGTVIDITESKRSEEALRGSEQVARGQVEALAQSLDVLATAPDPEKFIGQMLNTIGRLLDAQSVSLWLFDESTDSPILRSMVEGGRLVGPDPEHPFVKDPLVLKQNVVIQELLFTAGPVVSEDLETDPRIPGVWRDYLKGKGAKRFLGVPILVSGQVRGFIGVRHPDRAPYRPEQIELTQALAHQVMLAIQLNEFAEQGQRAAVFEERNRMARDIHDTLAQGFTGVIVQLEAAEDAISCDSREEADNHLRRAGELARRSLSEARRSVHALRPRALEEHDFWDALKGTIKNTTAGTALHPKFQAQGGVPELPQPWQENLLHIGLEALTNTLKYAHARTFETRLSYKANELRLELRDDGDGFRLKDRHDGVGLRGMHERVEQMGGELKIASSRGKGTKITVLLPCNGDSTL